MENRELCNKKFQNIKYLKPEFRHHSLKGHTEKLIDRRNRLPVLYVPRIVRRFWMFQCKNRQQTNTRATEYATCKDFQQIFDEDMAGLHRLAYLLTADQSKAEQCFVAGLEESINGNPVFKQWARTWSKRAIIHNAIKMIAPTPQAKTSMSRDQADSTDNIAANIVSWAPFERFVFVMAVLEGYSLRECATLLGTPVQDVITAKSAALQKLGERSWQEAAIQVQSVPARPLTQAQVA
jgi:DNA-directed RNA polymerase specialized sigma24 family protein